MNFALNHVNEAAYLLDEQARICYVNDKACEMLDYSRKELLAMTVAELDPVFPLQRWPAHWQDLRKMQSLTFESHHQRRDRSLIPVEISANYFVHDGRAYNLALVRNITERKKAEELLRSSETLLHAVIDSSADAIFVKDLRGRYLVMNQAGGALTGKRPEEVLGKDDTVLFPPDEAARIAADDQHIISSASPVMYEHMLTMALGQRMLQVRKGPVLDRQNKVIGVYGISRDITERTRMESDLKEVNELFSLFMHHSPVFIFIKEVSPTESRVLQASDNFETMIGIRGSDMVGRTMAELFPPEFAAKIVADDWAVVSAGKILKLEEEFNGRNYTTIKFPIVRGEKKLLAGYTIDITEKHQLEEERIKSQKLEAIGTLAGGIAHDFNNLLQGIFGYISLARRMKDNGEKCSAALEEAEKALHQSVNLTSQLLTFSKGGQPRKRVIDLRPLIMNSVKFALSGSRVDYALTVPDDLLPIEADEGQIGQVLQNMVLNADQAMPLGGRIEIAARNVPAAEAAGLQLPSKDNFLEITVRDQGTGIPPAHLSRIFDPYFTTKEKGSGLGLATSYSIIRNHGGLINVSSVMGEGSVFTLYLPASLKGPCPQPAPAPQESGKSFHLLVMDDEEVVRKVAAELLAALGHQVRLACHGEEALAVYQEMRNCGRPFDAVILDLTIRGGMGGTETLQKLKELDAGVKAIMSSGYSDDSALAEYEKQGFAGILSKPYSLDGLQAVLNEVMNGELKR